MLKGWKTLIFNLLSAVVAVLIAFDWVNVGLSRETAGLVIAGGNVVNMVLRTLTNTPVGKSE